MKPTFQVIAVDTGRTKRHPAHELACGGEGIGSGAIVRCPTGDQNMWHTTIFAILLGLGSAAFPNKQFLARRWANPPGGPLGKCN